VLRHAVKVLVEDGSIALATTASTAGDRDSTATALALQGITVVHAVYHCAVLWSCYRIFLQRRLRGACMQLCGVCLYDSNSIVSHCCSR
jgi:hypothetical protein